MISCSKDDNIRRVDEEMEPYQLFSSHNSTRDYHLKQQIIAFFKSVTLGSEYGTNVPLTRKWNKEMKIFVSGTPSSELLIELDTIINELNSLFSDGFHIRVVEDSVASNFHMYLGDAQTYGKMYPSINYLLRDNFGIFSVHYDNDFYFTHGHMYVDIYRAGRVKQKHYLREELTQALGFSNDIKHHTNSIFYYQPTATLEYSELDKEIIRLLYHPRMIAGVGRNTVDSILKYILGL